VLNLCLAAADGGLPDLLLAPNLLGSEPASISSAGQSSGEGQRAQDFGEPADEPGGPRAGQWAGECMVLGPWLSPTGLFTRSVAAPWRVHRSPLAG